MSYSDQIFTYSYPIQIYTTEHNARMLYMHTYIQKGNIQKCVTVLNIFFVKNKGSSLSFRAAASWVLRCGVTMATITWWPRYFSLILIWNYSCSTLLPGWPDNIIIVNEDGKKLQNELSSVSLHRKFSNKYNCIACVKSCDSHFSCQVTVSVWVCAVWGVVISLCGGYV